MREGVSLRKGARGGEATGARCLSGRTENVPLVFRHVDDVVHE